MMLRFAGFHSKYLIIRSAGLTCSRNIHSGIKNTWIVRYRIPISLVIKQIEENDSMYDELVKDQITKEQWHIYLKNRYRRKLIKEPSSILSEDEIKMVQSLMDKLSFIDNGKSLESIESRLSRSSDFDDVLTSQDLEQIKLSSTILAQSAKVSVLSEMKSLISINKALSQTSDMRLPHEWYPYARLMKRKIFIHAGPTNSGKTHQALQRLRSASSGIFCGPLRLLALEIYERLNREGTYTDLLTGQEKRNVQFATHISCTMEMTVLEREYDVAVIDEIQMISDPSRGWAWTRAFLGLRAKEIHLCGGMEALDVIKNLVAATKDDLEIKTYSRLSKLKVSEESLEGDYSKVRKGDCVVAFTRADIFSIKRRIEMYTPYKCAVIYGALPPEVRSMQARLFNEGSSYDVLIASDAIGMGLNLNIGRIIFHTTRKKGSANTGSQWIDPSSVKQIAGRAGRLSSEYKVGEVTTWQDADLPYVKAVLSWDIPSVAAAGVFPSVELVQQFYSSMILSQKSERTITEELEDEVDNVLNDTTTQDTSKNTTNLALEIPLSLLLTKFVQLSKVDSRYFLCDFKDLNLVSNWLHTVKLSIEDRFIFANAPVNSKNFHAMNMLYQYAAAYAQKKPVGLNVRIRRSAPNDFFEFGDLCAKHNILELYLWLSVRYPKYFIERDLCLEQKDFAMELIQQTLSRGINQDYSHADDYMKEYQNMINSDPLFLPPSNYGELRELTRQVMDKLQSKASVVFIKEIVIKSSSQQMIVSSLE